MRHDYFIYAFLDPRRPGQFCYGPTRFNYEPFYVGKGSGTRIQAHFWPKNLREKHPKNAKLRKLLGEGLTPRVTKLFQSLTEEEAFKKEIELIQQIGRKDQGRGPLLNLYDGGYGSSKSDVVRQKISRTKKEQYATGEVTHPMLGKKHSAESKAKMSKAHRGTKWTTEQKARLKKVRVQHKCHFTKWWLVKSPDGKETKVYGLGEFCRSNGLSQSHMFRVANGERHHHKGWKCQRLSG